MSDRSHARRLPVVITIIIALMLMVMPLPDWAQSMRPDFLTLTLIYWAMMLPRQWSIGIAWIVGLVLDVAQGTLLGQHALAMSAVVFATVRSHLLMRVFPLSQLTATVFALLALYQFILFWINGVAGLDVPAVNYWGPVIAGTLVWPVANVLLNGARMRAI
ncbi:MAG: rod shape-determining protein MreD [Pseudomonadota bacterium]